jgi:hypothetical protein
LATAGLALAVAMKGAPLAGNIYQQTGKASATSGIAQALACQWPSAMVQFRNCLEIIQSMIFF